MLFERLGDRCKYWITINEVSRPLRPESLRWTPTGPVDDLPSMSVVLMEQPHIFTMLSSMTYMKDRWNKDTDYAR